METYNDLVRRLIQCLEDSGVDYAFTGALAVSYYGSPRTTSDVDVMVAIGGEAGKSKVIDVLNCAGLDVSERRINDAFLSGYNIATFHDKASPFSVDVIFSSGNLEKRPGIVAGVNTYLQEPEGLLLAKLRMIKATIPRERAIKDEEDVKSILRFTKVDLKAVRRKAEQEHTGNILDSLTR